MLKPTILFSFIALRTKLSAETSDAENMAKEIENKLKIKPMIVIMRQKFVIK